MRYDRSTHAARETDDFVFQQLIPYIGNKRKLLWLIEEALQLVEEQSPLATFVDAFSGSTVVARFAKRRGLRVVANDWEPYAHCLATATVRCNREPAFAALGGYERAIAELNGLAPRVGWVTEHLCPADDGDYDTHTERLFFMRKNGMRIDAIRQRVASWRAAGTIDDDEVACLVAPLLYQACYTSNTSGVFKGFHEGWGGSNGTALHRIGSDLALRPLVFHDNGRDNEVHRSDANELAAHLAAANGAPAHDTVLYLDPPYNQHPYASNYHVLNTLTLWDRPPLAKRITVRDKAAIRTDWTERRSAYNQKRTAAAAFEALLDRTTARHVLVSYSTDGLIPLARLVEACIDRGHVAFVKAPYKRYRVSPTRPSSKPLNVEFVLILDRERRAAESCDAIVERILSSEARAIAVHRGAR